MLFVMTGGFEEVKVSELRVDDIVLHPEKSMWMRIVSINEMVQTTYDTVAGTETSRDYLLVNVDRLDKLPIETALPYPLNFFDPDRVIPRWTGAELPQQPE